MGGFIDENNDNNFKSVDLGLDYVNWLQSCE